MAPSYLELIKVLFSYKNYYESFIAIQKFVLRYAVYAGVGLAFGVGVPSSYMRNPVVPWYTVRRIEQ